MRSQFGEAHTRQARKRMMDDVPTAEVPAAPDADDTLTLPAVDDTAELPPVDKPARKNAPRKNAPRKRAPRKRPPQGDT